MRLAALLHAAEQLTQGAISGHTPVCFDIYLRGALERVVKFVRPKRLVPAQLEEHERLLLVQRLLDPMEAGWQAALATRDVDRAWAFWTTTAEETLLALACPDITPDTLGAPGLHPRPGQVGPGAGLGSGAGGGLLGRAGPGL